jgi:hypothetical protein
MRGPGAPQRRSGAAGAACRAPAARAAGAHCRPTLPPSPPFLQVHDGTGTSLADFKNDPESLVTSVRWTVAGAGP